MGMKDTEDQLDACRAQSVRDEAVIAELRNALTYRVRELEATIEGLTRQNAELEHDLTRAESALADRLQHDAHTRPTTHTIDPTALVEILDETIHDSERSIPPDAEDVADRILALVQPIDGILITPEEAQLAVRAARHSAESIRNVAAVDPARLHPDVAPYAQRLDDLADRLTR